MEGKRGRWRVSMGEGCGNFAELYCKLPRVDIFYSTVYYLTDYYVN